MGNVPKTWSLEDYPDVATHSFYNEILEQRRAKDPSKEPDMSDIMAGLQKKARDNARTPMQWDDSVNAGFSDGDGSVTPWMKVNEDYKEYNAKKEVNEPSSVFRFWQKALRFRKDNLACVSPMLETDHATHSSLLAKGRLTCSAFMARLLLDLRRLPSDRARE